MIVRAIQEKYVKERGHFEADALAFSNIFGTDFRKVIPLSNPELANIIDLLSSGKTRSGGKYKVNIEDNTATKESDKRTYSAGRVIGKELGKDYLDEWARQIARKGEDSGYSIVISRHPIDIMRMSDHDGIKSCHSPGGSYFACALEEANNGGAVAYIVDSSDLEGIDIQGQEIFEDKDRRIKGITPSARMRLNKYIFGGTESSPGSDLLIPVNKAYGRDRSGFYESVKSWVKSVQPDLSENNIDSRFENLERRGGSYADYNDSDIFNDFFDTNSFRGNAHHEGKDNEGDDLVDIWNEEINGFLEADTEKLEHTGVYATAEISDGIVYISALFSLEFSFEEFDSHVFAKISSWDKKQNFERILKHELGSINEVEDLGNGVIRLDFDINPENPDDLRSEISNFAWFEKSKYKETKASVYSWLVEIGAIEQTELHDKITGEHFDFRNMAIDWDGEGSYEVSFEIAIPKIPNDMLLVSGVEDNIVNELKAKVWDKLSKAYNVYVSQPTLIEGEDLTIAVQFPELTVKVYKRESDKTDVEFSWTFMVHDFTVRNQKVLMNFFKFLDKNFERFSESIFNEMSGIIEGILKAVPGKYYGKNWYERSRIWENKLREEYEERTRAIKETGEFANPDKPPQ